MFKCLSFAIFYLLYSSLKNKWLILQQGVEAIGLVVTGDQVASKVAHDVQTVFWQIAETYAFLPREAVTRFLMSCTECQKRMHFNSSGPEPKGGGHCSQRPV